MNNETHNDELMDKVLGRDPRNPYYLWVAYGKP